MRKWNNYKKKVKKVNELESRIDEKIKFLNEMLLKYDDLNQKARGKYNWRSNAISDQIEVLEEIKNNSNDNGWQLCYEEDLREFNISKDKKI